MVKINVTEAQRNDYHTPKTIESILLVNGSIIVNGITFNKASIGYMEGSVILMDADSNVVYANKARYFPLLKKMKAAQQATIVFTCVDCDAECEYESASDDKDNLQCDFCGEVAPPTQSYLSLVVE
jgi:hypothetical protein